MRSYIPPTPLSAHPQDDGRNQGYHDQYMQDSPWRHVGPSSSGSSSSSSSGGGSDTDRVQAFSGPSVRAQA